MAHSTKWTATVKFKGWEGNKLTVKEETFSSQPEAQQLVSKIYNLLTGGGKSGVYYYEGCVTPPKGQGKRYEVIKRTDRKYSKKNPDNPNTKSK